MTTPAPAATATATAYATIDSPLGPLTLRGAEVDDDFALTGIWMDEHRHGPTHAEVGGWRRDHRPFTEASQQLEQYFAGDRRAFDLRLHAVGTPFQHAVWKVLATIPYAETWTYLDVANALGSPTAVRAVGAANGRNPISIVVPCHRVIGADGSMTGYGGGVKNKQLLLAHERRAAGVSLF